MYPETDVPPIQLGEAYVEGLRAFLPELPEQKLERLMKDYGLNMKLARQILDSEYVSLFEMIAKETKVSATVIAATLTETVKALKRDKVEVEKVTDDQFREVFRFVDAEKVAKEALPDLIVWLSKHEGAAVKAAVESLGLAMISRDELERLIDGLLKENERLVKERGKGAFGALMGLVMGKARGRVRAELVSEVLKKKLERLCG